MLRVACGGALAGLSVLACAAPASAATINDIYYGGLDTYNNPGDVIGAPTFYITSADVTRPTNNTVNVTIHTNFAGAPGTSAADGTGYGALFFSVPGWNPTGSVPWASDQYHLNEWQYAVAMPTNPGSGSIATTSTGLYAIGNVTGVTVSPSNSNNNLFNATPGIVKSYTTQNGSIVMSNVGGDPITYPGTNNPGFYFRQGQAVQYTPATSAVAGTSANYSVTATTWTVNPTNTIDGVVNTQGLITFSIVDNGILGNDFGLAWAMTCANDVIQGEAVFNGNAAAPTPLPSALPLFAGGLGVMGFVARRRKKQASKAA